MVQHYRTPGQLFKHCLAREGKAMFQPKPVLREHEHQQQADRTVIQSAAVYKTGHLLQAQMTFFERMGQGLGYELALCSSLRRLK